MYVHIGMNYMIKKKYILGIFDIENTSTSTITRKFLSRCQEKNTVVNVTEELPKSYVLYCEKDKTVLYLSQFSTTTLKKRCSLNEME